MPRTALKEKTTKRLKKPKSDQRKQATKGKRGRPPLSTKKQKPLVVLLDEDLHGKIKKAARANKTTVSGFIRKMIAKQVK
jgi:hypothetical protein